MKLRPADADTRLDPSYFVSSDEEDAGTVDDMNEVGMLTKSRSQSLPNFWHEENLGRAGSTA